MNIDDALELADAIGEGDSSNYHLAAALQVLAGYVRRHRPTMPHKQRGRTVDHAVRPMQAGDGSVALTALCGGLAPEWHDTAPDVDQLGTFDPNDDHACKTCTRRLPRELRPAAPDRPPAVRRPLVLDGYTVESGGDDLSLRAAVDLMAPGYVQVERWPDGAALVDVLDAARRHARGAFKSDPHPADELL